MPNTIKYRDHEISRDNGLYDFGYHHKDYDGTEEDGRYGYHDTIQECKEAIDDWYMDKGESDE